MLRKWALWVLSAGIFINGCGPSTAVPEPLERAQSKLQCSAEAALAPAGPDKTASSNLSKKLKNTANQSRKASVHVINVENGGRGSGSYFVYKGRHIVVTAGHVSNYSSVLIVRSPAGEEVLAFNAYQDLSESDDVSVLLLTKPLSSREPMELKIREKLDSIIGETLVYTGHPAHHEALTIFGKPAGLADNGNIILHSYAWMGASGSAVLDEKGRLVGILRAVDFNEGPVVPQLTEDIVWLSPANNINLERLEKILTVVTLLQELEEEAE